MNDNQLNELLDEFGVVGKTMGALFIVCGMFVAMVSDWLLWFAIWLGLGVIIGKSITFTTIRGWGLDWDWSVVFGLGGSSIIVVILMVYLCPRYFPEILPKHAR